MGDQVSEALEIIHTWKPKRDVYSFDYGPMALTAVSTGSAMYINSFFRKRLKMKGYALATTYIASCIPAGLLSPIFHGVFVLQPLLSGTINCPVCLETRSSVTQAVVGVLYPMLLSPIACMQFAQRYMTARVPSVTKDPKGYGKWFLHIARPFRYNLLALIAFQVFIGGAVAHWEQGSLFTIAGKIKQMEEEMEAKTSPEYVQNVKEKANVVPHKTFAPPSRKYPFSVES